MIHKVPAAETRLPMAAELRAGADALRRHHLGELAATFLEAAAPLAVVGAQFLYAAGPFVGARAFRLARLLESEKAISELEHYLASHEDDSARERRDGP